MLVILGGTFNPVHIGHLVLAYEIQEELAPEKILLVPAYQPAHKDIPDHITPFDRLYMLQLALKDTKGIYVENCEIEREGISYSIETVRSVKKKYQLHQKPILVIGEDLFSGFDHWKNPQALVDEANLVIARRSFGHAFPSKWPHRYLKNRILEISSSQVRQRYSQGLSIRHLVPREVEEYIRQKNLYKTP